MREANTYLCEKRFIPFSKEPVLDCDRNIVMHVSIKFGWNPKLKFYVNGEIIFTAILKNTPGNPLKKQFLIFNRCSNQVLAVVSERSVHKKKSLFTEYDILVGDKNYKADYKPMYKGFKIEDEHNQLCVIGEKTDLIMSNFLKNRSYNVEIFNKEHNHFLWLAVIKGMQFLE